MQRKWLKTEGRIRKYDPAWVPDKSSRERLDALLKIWQVTAYSITNAPIRGHPGGGGGWLRGAPGHLRNDVYKSSLTKTKVV